MYGHWDTSLVGDFDSKEWFGFIYEITNTQTKKSYIGKKNFWSIRRLPPLKGNKRKRKKISEMNWREYTSSSSYLNDDIALIGKDKFKFIILELCSGKSELSYLEENYQHSVSVLTAKLFDGTPAYYNKSIANKHFAGIEKQSKESREKVSKSLKEYYTTNPKGNLPRIVASKISETLKRKYSEGELESHFSKKEEWSVEYAERMKVGRVNGGLSNTDKQKSAREKCGKTQGTKNKENQTGIFSQSKEEWQASRSSGGKSTGRLYWWTDGTAQKRSMEKPGSTWSRGRLPRSQETKDKISKSMKAKYGNSIIGESDGT